MSLLQVYLLSVVLGALAGGRLAMRMELKSGTSYNYMDGEDFCWLLAIGLFGMLCGAVCGPFTLLAVGIRRVALTGTSAGYATFVHLLAGEDASDKRERKRQKRIEDSRAKDRKIAQLEQELLER